MLADVLTKLGFYAGKAEELLEPQVDNPKGFWERRDVVQLNDLILEEAGGSWFNPPTSSFERDYTSSMMSILEMLSSSGSRWLIKDPRFLLTWPLWKEVLDSVVPIIIYRSPLAVAQSLRNRHEFPISFGLDLWEYYNRQYLAAFPNPGDSLFLSYDHFILDPEHEIKLLYQGLIKLGVLEKSDADLTGALAAFSPSLVTSKISQEEDIEKIMTPSQISVENYLNLLSARSKISKSDHHESLRVDPALGARIQDFSQTLAPLSKALENLNRLDEVSEERDHVFSELKSQESRYVALVNAHEAEKEKHTDLLAHYKTLENDQKELALAHEAEKEKHTDLLSHYKVLESDHMDLGRAYQLDKKNNEELEAKYSSLNIEHQSLSEAHHLEVRTRKNLEVKVRDLEAKVRDLDDKANYLFHELTDVYRNLLLYETSFQAKLSRIMSRLYRFISFQRDRTTPYLELIMRASQHFTQFDFEPPQAPVRRLASILRICRYIILHPASSIRSLSWNRLGKLFKICFRMSAQNLATWTHSRFPEDEQDQSINVKSIAATEIENYRMQFDVHMEPEVTIIVPVYNEYSTTLTCLRSIYENTKEISYQIVVGDDHSTDLTKNIEERIEGIKVVHQKSNIGFLRNCNIAVREVKSRFLVLLNNDTSVEAGWLAELLETLKKDPSVGMVGPKLVFPNGRLQEAGGIIWKDGSGWNYGRDESPHAPQFNYCKEVDYISGACLLLRKALWDSVGGFDERFSPAYYEDTDLAFTIREAGYKVVYQPKARVIHYEGVTNGKDLSTGVKKYQSRNKEIFRKKWAALLEENHYENGTNISYARERSGNKRTILVIDHYVPHFDKDAGGKSTYQYILLLIELGYRVIFLGANYFPHQPYTDILQRQGVEVIFGEDIARDIKAWFKANAIYIDVIYIQRPHVAEQFLDIIEKLDPKPLIVYFGHDLHYLRKKREAQVKKSQKLEDEANSWEKREQEIFERTDITYYPSNVEVEEVRSKNPLVRARAIPLYALSLEKMPTYDFGSRSGLLFVGGFNHPPNVDAMTWFVRDILPHVVEQIPDVILYIVGSNIPETIEVLDGPNVEVLGFLSDEELTTRYSLIKVAVVPLRFGAGVKGKVIESVQQNVPIVSTSIGVEGIPGSDRVMEVSDNAFEFASKIIELHSNPLKVKELTDNYSGWLKSHFGKEVARKIILEDFGSPEKSDTSLS